MARLDLVSTIKETEKRVPGLTILSVVNRESWESGDRKAKQNSSVRFAFNDLLVEASSEKENCFAILRTLRNFGVPFLAVGQTLKYGEITYKAEHQTEKTDA